MRFSIRPIVPYLDHPHTVPQGTADPEGPAHRDAAGMPLPKAGVLALTLSRGGIPTATINRFDAEGRMLRPITRSDARRLVQRKSAVWLCSEHREPDTNHGSIMLNGKVDPAMHTSRLIAIVDPSGVLLATLGPDAQRLVTTYLRGRSQRLRSGLTRRGSPPTHLFRVYPDPLTPRLLVLQRPLGARWLELLRDLWGARIVNQVATSAALAEWVTGSLAQARVALPDDLNPHAHRRLVANTTRNLYELHGLPETVLPRDLNLLRQLEALAAAPDAQDAALSNVDIAIALRDELDRQLSDLASNVHARLAIRPNRHLRALAKYLSDHDIYGKPNGPDATRIRTGQRQFLEQAAWRIAHPGDAMALDIATSAAKGGRIDPGTGYTAGTGGGHRNVAKSQAYDSVAPTK